MGVSAAVGNVLRSAYINMILVLGLLLYPGDGTSGQTAGERSLHISDVQATRLDGSVFDGATLEGKIVLLDYWAVWCGPCLTAFPSLRRLNSDLREENFQVVGIATYSGTIADVRPVVDRYELDYTVVVGEPTLSQRFGVIGYPTYFLMDPAGGVHKKYVGELVDLYERIKADVLELRSQISMQTEVNNP